MRSPGLRLGQERRKEWISLFAGKRTAVLHGQSEVVRGSAKRGRCGRGGSVLSPGKYVCDYAGADMLIWRSGFGHAVVLSFAFYPHGNGSAFVRLLMVAAGRGAASGAAGGRPPKASERERRVG